MATKRSTRLAGLALAFSLGAAVTGSARFVTAARPALEPTGIGFLDVEHVLSGSEKLKDLEARIRRDRDAALSELAARSERLARKKDELEILTLGTASWRKLNREIRLEAFALKTDQEDVARDFDEKARFAYRDAYRDLNEAARDVATKRGFAAVFARSSIEPTPASDPSDVLQRIFLRQVIYGADELDVARDVLTALNGK